MTDREKMIELIQAAVNGCASYWAGLIADYLLANGVVVREKGEWIDHLVRDWRCSNCGEKIKKVRNVDGYCYDDKPNFCPNCGSDMRWRANDDL